MMSLFSSFDNFNYLMTGSWTSLFVFFSLTSIFMSSKLVTFFNTVVNFLHDFYLSISPSSSKFSTSFLVTFFFFFFFLNFSSVFPFFFSLTAHMYVLFPLALGVWLTLNIFQVLNSSYSFLIHMVPLGTPSYLVFFMVIVELISNSIRPLTLSVRLMANVFSGHLLMILLYNLVSLSSPSGLVSFFSYTALSGVELLVSLIQSYIFCTLVYLYYTDIF